MRKILIPLFGLLSFCLFGQTETTEAYHLVDQMPYFPGCSEFTDNTDEKRNCSNQNLVTYISDYLRYPEKARALGVEGTVYLSFIISENGEVIEPTITRDIGGGCGEVALQIVKNMPAWEPGILRGKAVPVILNLPVKFSLKNTKTGKLPDARIAWGNLIGNRVSKKQVINNLNEKVIVRDLSGNPLNITQLTFAYKKGRKVKEVESRGVVSSQMKKLVKKLNNKTEFAILATVQLEGAFVDVERVFKITK